MAVLSPLACSINLPLAFFWMSLAPSEFPFGIPLRFFSRVPSCGPTSPHLDGRAQRHQHLGKKIWLWVKTNGIPFWGRCTTHFRTYFTGDWDVHWGYGLLTHCLIYLMEVQHKGQPPFWGALRVAFVEDLSGKLKGQPNNQSMLRLCWTLNMVLIQTGLLN